jgi:hypothetical protein
MKKPPLDPDPITVSVTEIADTGELLAELDEIREAGGDDEEAGESEPAADQDVVDEIGKTIGVTYQEGEPLRVGGKEEDRDKHRWELDPASSEDYVDRLHEEIEAEPVRKMRHEHHVKRPS